MTVQLRIILALVVAVLIAVGGTIGTQTVLKWKHDAEQGGAATQTLQSTTGVISDGSAAQTQNTVREGNVASARGNYNNKREEAKTNEPETAQYLRTAVPVSLRNAARARRLARERSGCVGGECPSRSEASGSTER